MSTAGLGYMPAGCIRVTGQREGRRETCGTPVGSTKEVLDFLGIAGKSQRLREGLKEIESSAPHPAASEPESRIETLRVQGFKISSLQGCKVKD